MLKNYCREFIKMLNSLKRKDKNTQDNILWLINKYIITWWFPYWLSY